MATEARTHRYEAKVFWAGSTGAGYQGYNRAHGAKAPPATAELALSSDAAFLGDPTLLNPEQLLLVAASSCQLLSFLALAARARIDVVAYEDRPQAFMPEDERPVRVTEIHLRPRITLRGNASEERVRALVERAHRECFIANSLSCEVRVLPTFEFCRS
jgi:organic hydroperoxide reductase OsmC/OhrA